MTGTLEVAHIRATGECVRTTIPHTLAALQQLVGGYLEPLPRLPGLPSGMLMLVNEEGLLKHLAANPIATVLSEQAIVGDAVLLRSEPPEFASLRPEDFIGIVSKLLAYTPTDTLLRIRGDLERMFATERANGPAPSA